MSKPIRVQLRRTKGWRMPLNTVKVDRTTKWGNPFGDRDRERSWRSAAVEAFRLKNHHRPRSDFQELRGRNLACWCPIDAPCHADVLLQLANGGFTDSLAEPSVLSSERADDCNSGAPTGSEEQRETGVSGR